MSTLLNDVLLPDEDSDSEEELSSDGEPVQLGFLEEPVPDRPLVSRYFPSKCGGRPVRGAFKCRPCIRVFPFVFDFPNLSSPGPLGLVATSRFATYRSTHMCRMPTANEVFAPGTAKIAQFACRHGAVILLFYT